MPNNPLQKYFRQPKIFVGLPSKGIYNPPGSLSGDVSKMPVYGMTGMDEIISNTPDALLSGESTVQVIESCCPNILNAWDLTALDTDFILTAIKIATFGNKMGIRHTCSKCSAENEYEIELGDFIDHYKNYQYSNDVAVGDLKVKLKPMTYKQSTEFSLRNFGMQQQLTQVLGIQDEAEKNQMSSKLFQDLGKLQNEIYASSVESVEMDAQVVTEPEFIREWLMNSEKSVIEKIREAFDKNRQGLRTPLQHVVCDSCDAKNEISVDLDQANFFVKA